MALSPKSAAKSPGIFHQRGRFSDASAYVVLDLWRYEDVTPGDIYADYSCRGRLSSRLYNPPIYLHTSARARWLFYLSNTNFALYTRYNLTLKLIDVCASKYARDCINAKELCFDDTSSCKIFVNRKIFKRERQFSCKEKERSLVFLFLNFLQEARKRERERRNAS